MNYLLILYAALVAFFANQLADGAAGRNYWLAGVIVFSVATVEQLVKDAVVELRKVTK